MNVTRQSSKRASPNLFLFLVLTEAIAENALSTLAVAMGKIKQYQLKKRVNHMPRSRRSADPADLVQQHFRSAAANRPRAAKRRRMLRIEREARRGHGGPRMRLRGHYYRNTNLSRLGNLCCPGSGNRDKRCCQRHVAGAPFCPGWRLVLPTGTKCLFFLFFFSQFFFYLNYTFAFQLNLCIGIQCV